jgi:hypothetical protein
MDGTDGSHHPWTYSIHEWCARFMNSEIHGWFGTDREIVWRARLEKWPDISGNVTPSLPPQTSTRKEEAGLVTELPLRTVDRHRACKNTLLGMILQDDTSLDCISRVYINSCKNVRARAQEIPFVNLTMQCKSVSIITQAMRPRHSITAWWNHKNMVVIVCAA